MHIGGATNSHPIKIIPVDETGMLDASQVFESSDVSVTANIESMLSFKDLSDISILSFSSRLWAFCLLSGIAACFNMTLILTTGTGTISTLYLVMQICTFLIFLLIAIFLTVIAMTVAIRNKSSVIMLLIFVVYFARMISIDIYWNEVSEIHEPDF
jgi:hypothetical protein